MTDQDTTNQRREDPGMALSEVRFSEIKPPESYEACAALRRVLGGLTDFQKGEISLHGERSVVGFVTKDALSSEGDELMEWARAAFPGMWSAKRPGEGVFIDYSLVEEE